MKRITAIGDQKGVAAVEFAIILVFFLAIFVFGMIEAKPPHAQDYPLAVC